MKDKKYKVFSKFSFVIVLILGFYTNIIKAQEVYVSGDLGMGFQAFPSKVETFFNVNNDNNAVRIQQPAFSLGNGFMMNGALGYFINEYLGFELGFQYQISSKILFSQESVILTQVQLKELTLYARHFSFIPSLVIKAGDGKLQPFFKAGPTFGFVSQYLDEKTTIDTNVSIKNWKYSGPMALGLKMELGIQYNLNDNMAIYLVSSFSNMIYKPTHSDVTYASVNGVNVGWLQPFEGSILFVEWSDDPYNQGPQDPDKPMRLQTQSFSYSSISLQLGIRYSF